MNPSFGPISPFSIVGDLPRAVAFYAALAERDDGLRGFEVIDPDGYVIFLGRPA